jgi:putative transposase
MSHTYSQNVIHVVFSTKDRRKTVPEDFQPRIWAYAAGVCQKIGILVYAIGGAEDHVHLLIQIPPSLSVSKAVMAIKSNSSRWASEEGHKFAWQESYGAFSASHSVLPVALQYIQNQREHHRKMGFDEEFLALLKKHGMEFDSKFVFG